MSSTRPGASASAIQHHYDVGNEFYRLWLDPTLTYSCALWHGDEDLLQAQTNKMDWHLENARSHQSSRLLDIGCGWGGLLERATQHYGVKEAVGLSLSAEQIRWIEERQLPGIEARLESWIDHDPQTRYDVIVSIGAFEHFSRLDQTEAEKLEGYRTFFSFCHKALVPRGRLSLQTIIYENADRKDFSPFFAATIFPESDLPHLYEITRAIRGLFEIEVLRCDRAHYARTLRCWLSNLRQKRERAIAVAGEELVARYEKYLGLMIVAFHIGTMNLVRVRLRRIDGLRSGAVL